MARNKVLERVSWIRMSARISAANLAVIYALTPLCIKNVTWLQLEETMSLWFQDSEHLGKQILRTLSFFFFHE
jgi:predicted phosphoadenosine phosphosulfate sulfurtransferase